MTASTAPTDTTPANPLEAHELALYTRYRLLHGAPDIGAALRGIEAIAELLIAAEVDREGAIDEGGDAPGWQRPFTAGRHCALIGAAAVLARYAHDTIRGVIGEGADDRMMWGSDDHLDGDLFRSSRS